MQSSYSGCSRNDMVNGQHLSNLTVYTYYMTDKELWNTIKFIEENNSFVDEPIIEDIEFEVIEPKELHLDYHTSIDPNDCDHDWNGLQVFISAKGHVIRWFTYSQWASLTDDNYRARLIYEHHLEIEDPIVEGSCECIKCHAIFRPNFFMI